jgi:LuxR family maltose regulon positive regulatory protein
MHVPPAAPPAPRGAVLADPLGASRFAAPRFPLGLVPRTALVDRLMAVRRKRCVVIQGPPGSGKTSTLLAYRRALLTHGFEVGWLQLAPEDNELAAFLQALSASIAEVDPVSARNALLLASSGQRDAQAVEHFAIALAQDLSRRAGDLALVIDDLHLLTDAGVLQALQWLLEYSPPTFHLVFASRETPPHPLGTAIARWRQLQSAAEFSLADLRFSPDESEQFLRERVGAISHEQAMQLHARTDGWVAGLQLLSLGYSPAAAAVPEAPLNDAGGFAAYFEHHVLGHLPADRVRLLTQASICPSFCADLCAALLGGGESAARIEQQLAELDRKGLFITQEDPAAAQTWWRLHPLLREVLNARMATLPAESRRELHRRAWRWFAERESVGEAVRHAVLAGEDDAAAQMVEAGARDLLARGEFAQMAAVLGRLPEGLVERRQALRFARAHVRLNSRDLQALDADVAALDAVELPPLARAELDLLRCGAALHRDDVDLATRLAREIAALPPGADALLATLQANLLAWVHLANGEYARAREVLHQSPPQDSAVARLTGWCLLGLSHTLEGRMVDAEHLYRQVLQEAETHGAGGVQVANLAAALLGDVLYELDALEAVCALLDHRMDFIEHVGMPEAILRAAMVLTSAHWLCGRRLEALAQLDRLEDFATRHGLPRLQAHALGLRVRLLQQRGEMLAVSDALCRLDELAARRAGQEDSVSQEIHRLAERAQISVHLHRGEVAAAAAGLRRLLARFREVGRMRPAAALMAQLALAERALGHAQVATPLLVDALRQAHRLGLLRTLLDASRRAPAALRELVDGQALDPVLDFYARRLLAVAARQRAPVPDAGSGPAPPGPVEPLKERELEILGLLAQALPNKKIARILGLSPETVKWHLKNIYTKLGVTARDAAVARARDLHL